LVGGLGFGVELLLEDLELLLLSGKAGTLVRLELIDLLAKCGDLRRGFTVLSATVGVTAGLKKNCPVNEEFSHGTCFPSVDLSTSFRTSIITSLMLTPSVPIWRLLHQLGTLAVPPRRAG
jgi:hypothetical protein